MAKDKCKSWLILYTVDTALTMIDRYWGSAIYVPNKQKFYFYGGVEQYVYRHSICNVIVIHRPISLETHIKTGTWTLQQTPISQI